MAIDELTRASDDLERIEIQPPLGGRRLGVLYLYSHTRISDSS